jgi:Tfp pilus assembly major pilin PilA
MTTPTIIACVIIILLALLCIPFFKSYKVRKKQRDEEERITDLKYQTEKEKIKAYGESINEETRNKNK